jgi:hypothetical protein
MSAVLTPGFQVISLKHKEKIIECGNTAGFPATSRLIRAGWRAGHSAAH